MKLTLQPLTISEGIAFVNAHHRHHVGPVGGKFAIGINDGEKVVGAIVIGRPVARNLDNGWTAEVTRCCVVEGIENGCSMLYGAAWRAAKAMGYKRMVTYTLASEPGVSLRAAGWRLVAESPGGSWSCKSRPRVDKHPLQKKLRWEA